MNCKDMCAAGKRRHRAIGISLIEMILAMVVAAIAASGIFAYSQGLLRGSNEPIAAAQALSLNKQEMEALVGVYNRYVRGDITWAGFVNTVNQLAVDGVVTAIENLTVQGQPFAGAGFGVIEVRIGEGGNALSAVFSE
jgi:type II secretory pathway pseudopilin PulG